MASDTAPAVPEMPPCPPVPAHTADGTKTPGGGLGWLASAVAPIDPARTEFSLTPAAHADFTAGQAGPAATSSSFNHATEQTTDTSSSKGVAKEGVVRTWMRAAAERWRRGADIHIKRLEMLKAKAQAAQYKEARTVTVNRSPGVVKSGGGPGSGSGLGSKSSVSKPGGGGGTIRNGNGNGKGSSGGGGGRPGPGSEQRTHRSDKNNGNQHRPQPGAGSAGNSRGDSRRGPHSSRHNDHAGRGTETKTPKAPKNSGSRHHDTHHSNSGGSGKRTDGRTRNGATTDTTTCGPSAGIDKPKKPKPGQDTNTSSGTGTGNGGTSPAKSDTGKGRTDKTSKPGTTSSASTRPTIGPDGKPIRTQPSREAGYRDGTRAAKVIAHVEAYKDGVKDGYHDTKEATDKEKTRLDKARTDRKQRTLGQPHGKENPVQPTASPTGQATPPQPVRVTGVTGTHVFLNHGQPQPADTPAMPPMPITPPTAGGTQVCTRGEIRSLKSYERILEGKAATMSRTAEKAKALEKHAQEQYTKAVVLLEQAREVKPGDGLITDLTRMTESAATQVLQASELHKRAVRAAEQTMTLLVNVKIRYGEVYDAICNSPLTSPAELDFYRDRT